MILVIDTCREKDSLHALEFVRPITDILKECAIVHFTEINKEIIEAADKIIISGSPLKEAGYSEHLEFFKWLKDYDKPLLGICNGIQIIGMTRGCELKEVTEIGPTTITKLQDDFLVNSMKKLEVYELHNYCINLPEDFELLAKSDNCIQS